MHCEQCHRPLAHAHEICKSCNVELSYPIRTSSGYVDRVSRYKCPACDGSFERWTNALRPANARWYVPQSTKTVCPLCAVELEWKRVQEPAQLSEALQGIALGLAGALSGTTPQALSDWLKMHWGAASTTLVPLTLVTLFFIAARPPVLATGHGAGHFVSVTSADSSRRKSQVFGILLMLLLVGGYWTAPQAHKLTVWAAGFGLAVMGCLLAVIWRIRTEKRLRRSAP
ncbi:hypothetical protein [Acidovorax sp. 1608163]|uniref:hypothetical protein n=1 Tax=Acidovorax sp. 1608163 TaxID=2478662 RepID=UPI0013CF0ED4|nr:hypothetical protein [Acidovorax sp. 1608163]